LANIGASIGGVNFPEMAEQALAIRAAREQQTVQKKVGEIAAKTKNISDPYERVAAMVSELAGEPGTEDLIGKLSNVLAQLKPAREGRPQLRFGVPPGSPVGTPAQLMRIFPDGTVEALGVQQPELTPYQRASLGIQERTAARAEEQAGIGNVEQNKLADFGTRMLEGHASLTALENTVPGIGQAVDAKLRAWITANRLPGVGKAAGALVLPATIAAMTPDEQIYWGAQQDLINARLRKVTGATINVEELETERAPLVPLMGEAEVVVTKKQARRFQAARLYIRGAGRAFDPDLLSPEARALLQALTPTAPARPREDAGTGDWRSKRPHE
jgi:hypothetical protein